MKWFQIGEPDNPMSIRVDAIAYVVKTSDGCKLETVDGTEHVFHAVSYEEMLKKLGILNE